MRTPWEQPHPLLPFGEPTAPEIIERSDEAVASAPHGRSAEEIEEHIRIKNFYVRQMNLRLQHAPFHIADIENYPPLKPETTLVVEPAVETNLDGAPSYRGKYTLVNTRGALDIRPKEAGGKEKDPIGPISKKLLQAVARALFREMSSEK